MLWNRTAECARVPTFYQYNPRLDIHLLQKVNPCCHSYRGVKQNKQRLVHIKTNLHICSRLILSRMLELRMVNLPMKFKPCLDADRYWSLLGSIDTPWSHLVIFDYNEFPNQSHRLTMDLSAFRCRTGRKTCKTAYRLRFPTNFTKTKQQRISLIPINVEWLIIYPRLLWTICNKRGNWRVEKLKLRHTLSFSAVRRLYYTRKSC